MSKNSKTITTSRGTKITMTCRYPKENPEGAIDTITRHLAYIGIFKGIDELFGRKPKDNDLE